MRKFAFLCLLPLLAITFGCVMDHRVTLVKDGQPLAGIVINAKDPTRSAQFAAYELQHVIKLITGAELPIVNKVEDVKGVAILIGASDATRKLKIQSGAFKGEEYLVAFTNKQIVLVGNDSPDYGKVDYADPKTFPALEYTYRSTTYAVYDFLEKCCGVRFYSYGDEGIALEKSPTLTVKPVSIRFSPKMDAYRQPYLGDSKLPPRDVHLQQLRWRVNTIFGVVSHSVYPIFFRYWGPALGYEKLFIEKRPEYFAQGYAGTFAPNDMRTRYPNDPDLPPSLCVSHPGPIEYFADRALKVYQGERVEGALWTNMRKMPDKPFYYPFQEDDHQEYCKCDKCRSLFPDIAPEHRYNYIHFDLVNRIAEAAAKRNPEIGIATLAYGDTLRYPDPKKLQLQPNVAVQMCLGIHSWAIPEVYSWQHKTYKDWIDNEVSKRPLFVWTYMLEPAYSAQKVYKYGAFFPSLYPWRAGRIYKEFAMDGVRGCFIEGNPTFHLLEAYVANKMCFDPSIDTDKLVDEYFTLYYGKAAEPMRRFYRTVEEITWNPQNYPADEIKALFQKKFKNSSVASLHTEKVNWHLGTPERIAELQKIIEEAEKQAATPIEKQRVKWFVDHIWTQAVEGRKAFENRVRMMGWPVPRVFAARVGNCGGDPEKVDFAKAAKSGGWTTVNGDKIDPKPGLFLAFDDEYFYLKYHESGDTALKQQKAGLWSNNVEIFLAAKPDYPYGQLALAPNGEFKALRHSIVNDVVRMDEWPVKPMIKNQLDEKGWTFYMAIPLKQLLPDQETVPADKIFANFMRTRGFDGGTSWSWSPIFTADYAQGLYRMGQIFMAFPLDGSFEEEEALPEAIAADLIRKKVTFESGAEKRWARGWAVNKKSGTPPLSFAFVETGAPDGKRHIRVNSTGSTDISHIYTVESMPASEACQCTFSGRGEPFEGKPAVIKAIVVYYNDKGSFVSSKILGVFNLEKDWKTFTFDVPAAGDNFGARLAFEFQGSCDLDNVKAGR